MKNYRNTFILIFTIFVIYGCKKDSSPQITSLLKNGNIETGFDGWSFGHGYGLVSNPNGYDFGYTSEAATSPKNSLKINCNSVKNDSAFCYYSQSFPAEKITVGKKITLKVKIKTVNITGNGISLAIRGDKDKKQSFFFSTETTKVIKGNSDFTEYTLTTDAYKGDASTIYIFLVFENKTTGYVYFDDVEVTAN